MLADAAGCVLRLYHLINQWRELRTLGQPLRGNNVDRFAMSRVPRAAVNVNEKGFSILIRARGKFHIMRLTEGRSQLPAFGMSINEFCF